MPQNLTNVPKVEYLRPADRVDLPDDVGEVRYFGHTQRESAKTCLRPALKDWLTAYDPAI